MSGHDAKPGKARSWLAEHYLPDNKTPKQAFKTFAEAKDEADRRNERDKAEPDYRPSIPYSCPYGDGFHIGHSDPKRYPRKRKKIPVKKGMRQ